METTLDYIKEGMDENREEHKEILILVKKELSLKADKARVDKIELEMKESRLSTRSWVQWVPVVLMFILSILIFIGG